MICFEVSINGVTKTMAGIGDMGVLSAIVNWVVRDPGSWKADPEEFTESELDFRMGGLDTRTDEFVEWAREDLKVGDEVLIRVVEDQSPDHPKLRRTNTCTKPPVEQRRKMYEDLKREFEPEAQ